MIDQYTYKIELDNNKRIWFRYKGERFLIGNIKFTGAQQCYFIPMVGTSGHTAMFNSKLLTAISKFLLQAEEMPSDKEIDGLFNDKPEDIQKN